MKNRDCANPRRRIDRMKIIFIGGRNIHTLGGIENYMYNLATQLARQGFTPVVYCESDVNKTEYVNGFKVIHQPSVGGRFLCKILLGYKATFHSLRHEKDAAVYHYNAWPPSLASWMARLAGKKTILQGHGLEWKRTKYTPFQQKIMRLMEAVTTWMHPHMIMVSEEQTVYFRQQYGRKCETIPTAVNLPAEGECQSEDCLRKYGLEPEGYFLYLGRLVQDKNPDVLIEAYIQSGITNRRLVIAGTNPADPAYVDKLHRLAAGHPGILFTGAVYGPQKEGLLKACYAFCLPSTLEGLPITLLEAMSYRRICIVSDIPAAHEALGETGVWVTPENTGELAAALRYAVTNRAVLQAEAEGYYQRVAEHFTWDRVAARYARYVEALTESEAGAGLSSPAR